MIKHSVFYIAFALIMATPVKCHIGLYTVCDTKSVQGHTRVPTSNTVEVALWKTDGTRQTCFEPSEKYHVTVKVVSDYDDTYIKGILMTSDEGNFPDTRVHPRPAGIPIRIYENEEKCAAVSRSGKAVANYETITNRVKELKFGFTAPGARRTRVEFRYSVVFSFSDFIENEATAFDACSVTPAPTITPSITPSPSFAPASSVIVSASESPFPSPSPSPTLTPIPPVCDTCLNQSFNCPKSMVHYKEIRNTTIGDKNYYCESKVLHRNFTCQPTCEKPLKCSDSVCPTEVSLQCSLVHTIKRRKFDCIADDGSVLTDVKFDVDVQQGCSCKPMRYSYESL